MHQRLQCLPDMFFDKTNTNVTSCFDTTSDKYIGEYLNYSIGRTVVGFGIPLLIMICCYGHVAFTLMTKKGIDVILKLRCLSDELLMRCFVKCRRARQSAAVSLVADCP
ncbi:hypothetical protein G5714_022618 [Onychostoma macrolepis]|uniref:Uncharacterized protein n=1 Tax=Onychostoma macrolepis TaxID=369639 RepID=A0A7J6BNQ4_9TELE|nr:hypothetical protein G5714_022618 [Onychostoma macrolepis]